MNAEKARIETQKCEREVYEKIKANRQKKFNEVLGRIQGSVMLGRYHVNVYSPRYMDFAIKIRLQRLGYVVDYDGNRSRYTTISWKRR
jgi:hypothetical protein